jgi:5-methylcytosine-specific restriction protein A
MKKPCTVCGEPFEGSRCPEHPKPGGPNVAPPSELGYDTSWRKLSERARRIQPWCSDCGTDRDLTGDHSPEAWQRKAEGKPIRLQDIDVLCRSCNTKRGKQRPETWGETPSTGVSSCADEAKSPLHTGGMS